MYTQLCRDTVAFTFVLHDFFKSFYLERFVSWLVCFLSDQFLFLDFSFSVSLLFKFSPDLKSFWSRFSLQWMLSFVFEHTRLLVEALDCSGFLKQKIACNLCVKLHFYGLVALLPIKFVAIHFFVLFESCCWQIWKCAFPDFLIRVSNLFFLHLGPLVHLETLILLSFHSYRTDNLQSFLVICFRSLSLW